MPNRYGSAEIGASGPPYRRAPRLGPRAFGISVVNSFWGNFVGGARHLYSLTNFKLNHDATLAECSNLFNE